MTNFAVETYSDGIVVGEANVLETLGVSRQTYDELKKLKDLGSAVLVYAKVSDPIEFEVDTEFQTAITELNEWAKDGPRSREMASGSTSYGSSPIDVPQGPGAGTASGASIAEGTYKPREYDTGDPWKDSSK